MVILLELEMLFHLRHLYPVPPVRQVVYVVENRRLLAILNCNCCLLRCSSPWYRELAVAAAVSLEVVACPSLP